jgi:steroid delta-isomerase-like uncharacterized protein
MNVETNKSLVQRFYNEVWNTWDEQAVREILSPEIDFRGSIGLQKHGHDGFIEYMKLIRSIFPDFHNQIDDLIAEGDKLVARLTYTGTHNGPIFGIEATGRRISYRGVAIFEIAESKINKVWVLGDLLSLLKQIGAISVKVD